MKPLRSVRSSALPTAAFAVSLLASTAWAAASPPAAANGLSARVATLEGADRDFAVQLIVDTVAVDGPSLDIRGVNFDNGETPEVEIAGMPVPVSSYGPTDIQVSLDFELAPRSYLLTVATGPRRDQFDAFTITTGAVGPVGPQGPAGPQGVSGLSGYEIVVGPSTIGSQALCPPGKLVVGGGGSDDTLPRNSRLAASTPLPDGRGWFCVNLDPINNAQSECTPYAICVDAP